MGFVIYIIGLPNSIDKAPHFELWVPYFDLSRSIIRLIKVDEEIYKCYRFMKLHKLHIPIGFMGQHE